MADPAVAGPGAEFHLANELGLGPFRVLGAGARQEGRGVAANAMEGRPDRAAELNRPAGIDRARRDQAPWELLPAWGMTAAPRQRASCPRPGATRFGPLALYNARAGLFRRLVGQFTASSGRLARCNSSTAALI
jgi:hypothetical protein